VHSWPMMLNDTYGDCTIAGAGHMIQDWTAYAGTMRYPTDAQILSAYWKVSGGVGVDDGANMLDVLNLWRQTGIGGDTISAYVQLDVTDKVEPKNAVYLFGNLYIGISLPDYVVNVPDLLAAPWELPSGQIPPPNPNNGHAVCIVGYDANYVYTVTWGSLKRMSWGFYFAYVDEAYAVLSNDWIEASGKSPEGFDVVTLQSDLTEIIGQQPPPPEPPPPPPPEPPPPPPPEPPTPPPQPPVPPGPGCVVWLPVIGAGIGVALYELVKLI